MRVQIYQILHFLGIFMIFLGYGGLIVRAATGSANAGLRRLGAMTSGIGLFLTLLGGFGLLARLGYGWPGWVLVKIGIWLVLGFLIVVVNRKPQLSQVLWWVTLVLGLVAILMVVLRPF
jgi:hypothetical protein